MGNLVFQATLGGQVNLVGPNTASTFNLNVPAVAGTLVTTGDSGTVTNTMLATSAYTAPGTIGSGTANTGAFTTLSASSTVSGTGFSTYLASPPAIGGTAAAAGAFTTLSASSTVSGTGFSTYLASPPAIGGTAAAAGTFTTLSGTTSVTTPIVKSASSLTLQSNGTTTAVTIDTSQNVGIGTSSPAGNLQISGSGDRSLLVTGGTSGTISVQLGDSAAAGQGGMSYDNAVDALFLKSNGSERMRIDSSGNVGIGTTSMSYKLQVAGTDNNNAIASYNTASGNSAIRMQANSAGIYIQASGTVDPIYFGNSSASGYIVFRPSSDTERMRIDSSGNLLVGTTNATGDGGGVEVQPNYQNGGFLGLKKTSSSASGDRFQYFTRNGSVIGSITQNGTTGVLYNLTSDYRLKNNPVALTGAKDFVMALQPKKWQWWDGSGEGVGFIAHEFMEVAKYSGNGEKDAVDANGNPIHQSIQPSSSEVMANMVSLMQEQQALIDTQAETINALTARVVALEAK